MLISEERFVCYSKVIVKACFYDSLIFYLDVGLIYVLSNDNEQYEHTYIGPSDQITMDNVVVIDLILQAGILTTLKIDYANLWNIRSCCLN